MDMSEYSVLNLNDRHFPLADLEADDSSKTPCLCSAGFLNKGFLLGLSVSVRGVLLFRCLPLRLHYIQFTPPSYMYYMHIVCLLWLLHFFGINNACYCIFLLPESVCLCICVCEFVCISSLVYAS